MTQQPFSRPGAVDLSGLKRPSPTGPPAGGAGAGPAGASGAGSAAGSASYAVDVSEENFQSLLDASVTAPVVLVFYSPTRSPESVGMAEDAATAAGEYDGRFLAGLIDIDASPTIAQAMQIPQVPLLLVILDGRPAAQPIPGVLTLDEMRALFNQLAQGLTAQGITGRHQPLSAPPPEGADAEDQVDPRYAAVAEYQRLVEANPADVEAAAGLAMARVLQRTQGVDDATARAAAEAAPDDVDAQTLVADLDLMGGRVDEAFTRLVELVRRTVGDERNLAREHLIGLFAAVGNDDPRVLRGRQALASALF
jgi:putative thioredoxin